MSWLKIDDAFEDHPKVEPLSDAAHRLWMRAATWCKKPANQHTNGFVPRALIDTIAKRAAPTARLLRLAQELVDARGGGTFEHGLWEPVDGGWRFHDWADYQPTAEPQPKLSRSEAARVAGQRSAEVRRAALGTAQPRSVERTPNDSRTFGDVRPNDVHRTSPEPPEPPDPVPLPRPRSQTTTAKDLPGIAHAPAGEPTVVVVSTSLNSLEEALAVPIRARAEWLESHQSMATWVQPERWPEVQLVAAAFASATAREVNGRLGNYQRDAGVRALVALYAAGYQQAELVRAVTLLVDTDWWRKEGASRGLSTFTIEVVRRVVTADPLGGELDPVVRKILAEREQRKAQTSRTTGAA